MLSALLAIAVASGGGPRVHVEVERGPKAVVLVARQASARELRGLRRVEDDPATVCRAPCDVEVPADAPGFFVAGPGVLPSPHILLPPEGDVTVRVRAGRRGGFLAGWVLAGVGAPALVTGAALMTLADNDRQRLQTGAVVAGAGVSLVLTGAILIATGRTRVRVD
jgi:hypothetical protein